MNIIAKLVSNPILGYTAR